MAKLEKEIAKAHGEGHAAFAELERESLFRWLGKLLLATVYKETFLSVDRSSEDQETIVTLEQYRWFTTLAIMLQSIRVPTEFVGFTPYSVQVFPVLRRSVRDDQRFNFLTSVPGHTVGLWLDHSCVVASLLDHGETAPMLANDAARHSEGLTYLEFVETFCNTAYLSLLFRGTPSYIVANSPSGIQVSPKGFSRPGPRSDYVAWDNEAFARMLAHYAQVPLETVWREGDRRSFFVRPK